MPINITIDHTESTYSGSEASSSNATEKDRESPAQKHDLVDQPPTEPEPGSLRKFYRLCIKGYALLLDGAIDNEPLQEKVDCEYVRLQLWGTDVEILANQLDILRTHELYKIVGSILLRALRRLAQLALEYRNSMKPTGEHPDWFSEVNPLLLHTPPGYEDVAEAASRSTIDTNQEVDIEQKVKELHDKYWAERGDHGKARAYELPGVTLEDAPDTDLPRRHSGLTDSTDILMDYSESIFPEDSASSVGIRRARASHAYSPKSSVVSGEDTAAVVEAIVRVLAEYNNCLFSLIKGLEMAQAKFGDGPLSRVYNAVQAQIESESPTMTAVVPYRAQLPGSKVPIHAAANSEARIDTQNGPPGDETDDQKLMRMEQQVKSGDQDPRIQLAIPSPPPIHHTFFPVPPQLPSHPMQFSPPPTHHSPLIPVPPPPAGPMPATKSHGHPQDQNAQINSGANATTVPATDAVAAHGQTLLHSESIVAAAMTKDPSILTLMHAYEDVGFGLYYDRYQQMIKETIHAPWVAVDVIKCMWNNASTTIKTSFRELAKKKLSELILVDNAKPNVTFGDKVKVNYFDLPSESSVDQADRRAANYTYTRKGRQVNHDRDRTRSPSRHSRASTKSSNKHRQRWPEPSWSETDEDGTSSTTRSPSRHSRASTKSSNKHRQRWPEPYWSETDEGCTSSASGSSRICRHSHRRPTRHFDDGDVVYKVPLPPPPPPPPAAGPYGDLAYEVESNYRNNAQHPQSYHRPQPPAHGVSLPVTPGGPLALSSSPFHEQQSLVPYLYPIGRWTAPPSPPQSKYYPDSTPQQVAHSRPYFPYPPAEMVYTLSPPAMGISEALKHDDTIRDRELAEMEKNLTRLRLREDKLRIASEELSLAHGENGQVEGTSGIGESGVTQDGAKHAGKVSKTAMETIRDLEMENRLEVEDLDKKVSMLKAELQERDDRRTPAQQLPDFRPDLDARIKKLQMDHLASQNETQAIRARHLAQLGHTPISPKGKSREPLPTLDPRKRIYVTPSQSDPRST